MASQSHLRPGLCFSCKRCVLYSFTSRDQDHVTNRELMMDSDLTARLTHESVNSSICDLSCANWSMRCGPIKPCGQKNTNGEVSNSEHQTNVKRMNRRSKFIFIQASHPIQAAAHSSRSTQQFHRELIIIIIRMEIIHVHRDHVTQYD